MDRVFLQNPILRTCSGRRAPRNVGFTHMYGPKFGTLLPSGTHIIVGRITYNNDVSLRTIYLFIHPYFCSPPYFYSTIFTFQTLQHCKTQVHVIIQTCPTPKYLISQCEDSKICYFSCLDDSLELQGESKLTCREDLTWDGHLPLCRGEYKLLIKFCFLFGRLFFSFCLLSNLWSVFIYKSLFNFIYSS